MMTQQIIKRFIQAGAMAITMLVALPACTDDHFEIQDGSKGDGLNNATLTLWQQIQARPDLSKFANLLERTPYFKDEKHPIAGYTFKDVLSNNQVLTVFAPNNDAISDTEFAEYEELLGRRPYDVYLRLIGNHIVRNNYVATGVGVEDIIMINNKKATFDRAEHKLKDLTLKEINIPAINGTLHTLAEQSPFAYNVYEYLRANDLKYPELNKWLAAHDTIYFNASASAEFGSNPETGEPIYVDSVYTRYNSLYSMSYEPAGVDWEMSHKGFGFVNLENEDSLWAMVLPSNAAWLAMTEKMKPWYVYAPKYFDMTLVDAMLKDDGTAKKNMVRDMTGIVDTLWKDAIAMDISSPLTFNVRTQPRTSTQTEAWTVEKFKEAKMSKMFNNRKDSFTVAERVKTTEDSEDVKAKLFGTGEPVEVSNGLIYPVDSWNFFDTYGAMDVEVKVAPTSVFQSGRYNLTSSEQKNTSVYQYVNKYNVLSFNSGTSLLANEKGYGRVSEDYFCYVSNDNASSSITLKLKDWERNHDILSGVDYEIGLVMVPTFYRYDKDSIYDPLLGYFETYKRLYDPESGLEDPDEYLKRYYKTDSLQIRFSYVDENGTEKSTGKNDYNVYYGGNKVDTVWIEKDGVKSTIKFPVSYKNLKYAYPTMSITALYNSAAKKRGHVPDFCIDRVILKAKKE